MLRMTVFSLEAHLAPPRSAGSVSPEFTQSLMHARSAIDLMLHRLHPSSAEAARPASREERSESESARAELETEDESEDRKPAADGLACSQDGGQEELGIRKSAGEKAESESSFQRSAARLFNMFDDPSSGHGAGVIAVVSILVLLCSIVLFVLETDPMVWRHDHNCPAYKEWVASNFTSSDRRRGPKCEPQAPKTMKHIELVTIIYFSVEYTFRLFTAWSVPVLVSQGTDDASDAAQREISHEKQSSLYRTLLFVRHPMNVIDVFAVVPFWVEWFSGSSFGNEFVVLRLLRMTRMFRVLKFGKYNYGLRFIGNVLYNSMSALILLIFFVGVASIISGSLVYYCERGHWSEEEGMWKRSTVLQDGSTEPSPFYSIPRSLWWVVVTITTVGYGDYYPTSIAGKVVGVFTMLFGVLLLALPVTIIGSEFTIEYEQSQKEGHSKLFALPDRLDLHMPEALQKRLPRRSRLDHLFDVVTMQSTVQHGVDNAKNKFLSHVRSRDSVIPGAQAAEPSSSGAERTSGQFSGVNPRFSAFPRRASASARMPMPGRRSNSEPTRPSSLDCRNEDVDAANKHHSPAHQEQDSATSAEHGAAADHDQKPPLGVRRKDQTLI